MDFEQVKCSFLLPIAVGERNDATPLTSGRKKPLTGGEKITITYIYVAYIYVAYSYIAYSYIAYS